MTTRQIAEAVGKTERAVRNWTRKAAENFSSVAEKMTASSPMRPADYNLDEVTEIIKQGMGANAAAVYRQNAEQSVRPEVARSSSTNDDIDREFKAAIAGLYKMLQSHENRIQSIERDHEHRKALAPPPGMSTRQELVLAMRKVAHRKYNGDHASAWAELSRQMYYRCSINLKVRANNDGVRRIDILERDGLLETATSIALEMLT